MDWNCFRNNIFMFSSRSFFYRIIIVLDVKRLFLQGTRIWQLYTNRQRWVIGLCFSTSIIIHTIYDEDDDGDDGDGRTDCARDTIYAYELKVVVMPVIYVAFRLCDYNLYVCPALRNETCFWFIFRYYINASARTYTAATTAVYMHILCIHKYTYSTS